jgi:hypothetical protein
VDNLIIDFMNVRMVEMQTKIESCVIWVTDLEKTECAKSQM